MLRAFAVTFTFIGGSATSCEPPLNCGEYNKSTACNHTFTGCDICDTCCKSWLKPVDICDGCVKDECTSGRHPDCCVSFRCDALTGQCIRAFRATGAYPNMSACEKACSAPSGVCTGSSVDLVSNDCNAWRSFSLDPMYKGWIERGSAGRRCTRIRAIARSHSRMTSKWGVRRAASQPFAWDTRTCRAAGYRCHC
jgi:hypothetical protein